MKSIKIFATLILLSFIFISTFACKNDELSRSNAAQLIKEKFQYPKELPFQICTTRVSVSLDPKYAPNIENLHSYFDRLQGEGLLTYTSENDNSGFMVFTASFTDKAKPFVVGETKGKYMGIGNKIFNVKVGNLNFGEITGIVERKEFNIAEVDYTESIELTPFGKVLGVGGQSLNRRTTFTKFDDGWRISK